MSTSVTVVKHCVAAELGGLYWGEQHAENNYDWGPIERAHLSDPRFCKQPTNMTYAGNTWAVGQLLLGRLVPVTRTTTWEVGE